MECPDREIVRSVCSPSEIQQGVASVAARIKVSHDGFSSPVLLIGIMGGAAKFLMTLSQELMVSYDLATMTMQSYPGDAVEPEPPRIVSRNYPENLHGRHVVLVDDILDSGGTLTLAVQDVRRRFPRLLETAVLCRKPGPKRRIRADFIGVDVPDVFVVGYGMDYNGEYRDLPGIAELGESQR